MKTHSAKWVGITLTLAAFFQAAPSKAAGPDHVQVKGRAMYSFESGYYYLQTDEYVYKINRQKLNKDVAKKVEKASAGANALDVSIPRTAVVFLWPSPYMLEDVKPPKGFARVVASIQDSVKTKGGQLSLHGTSMYSFKKETSLVLVRDQLYELQASMLPVKSRKLLDSPGARVSIDAPIEAVKLVGTFKGEAAKGPAGHQLRDAFEVVGDNTRLVGVLLCSFEEPYLLVQSEGKIYKVRRDEIKTDTPEKLDNPGTKMQMSFPVDAIDFAWSVDSGGLVLQRAPANLKK